MLDYGFLARPQEWELEDARDPFVFRGGRPRKEQRAAFSVSRSLTFTCGKTSQVLAEQRSARPLVHDRFSDAYPKPAVLQFMLHKCR